MFCVADVFAKVFVTVIMVNATFEESMTSKAKKMEVIGQDIQAQMTQADNLLEKLMPPSVVEAMKAGKATGAEEYASVTIFFSGICNYNDLANIYSAKEMISCLDKLWKEYDFICKRWGIYRVETIGDTFLAVSGAPERAPDHAIQMTNFALEVIRMVENFRTEGGDKILLKIGLCSGPITAGVLGDSNPHWCVVGDTVNTASRMYSTSKHGKVHVTEGTYKLISGSKLFKIEGPDKMNIKGKGSMDTYWVTGLVN
ncbi:adenylate and guanylate cyclase catalytic domain-containing protein [Chytriomyces sp. MP71]|nr:adenylate and guanylate cyclase catalytic domain-containing protein [Chytriomyces sp. MP71]